MRKGETDWLIIKPNMALTLNLSWELVSIWLMRRTWWPIQAFNKSTAASRPGTKTLPPSKALFHLPTILVELMKGQT